MVLVLLLTIITETDVVSNSPVWRFPPRTSNGETLKISLSLATTEKYNKIP